MFKKAPFPILVSLVALALVVLAVALGWRVVRGDGSLLREVSVADELITPNADGERDATLVSYQLSRNAQVSIYFEGEDGKRYYFRQQRPRGAGEYEVYFSGVVDGFRLPGEEVEGEVVARLLPDGVYQWVVEAVDAEQAAERATGRLTIAGADSELPEIRNFTLDKHAFTPNQDGIDDRVEIDFFLPKEVEALRVFLLMPEDGKEVPITEKPLDIPARAPGRHVYDYAAGVDQKAAPPPDGTYPVVAIAEDAEGQKVRVEESLTLDLGGVPFAHIISPVSGDTVRYNATSVEICDTLYFSVTVENYGETPIRTTGPWSGTVYDSDWNYNTVGWSTEAGAWRVGIGYENALGDYPYRWGLGSPEELTKIGDHYYLMPGERAVVEGGIRLVDVFGVRNPQPVWAGLIHEDVEISLYNNRVDTHNILVDLPNPDQVPVCDERAVPEREVASQAR